MLQLGSHGQAALSATEKSVLAELSIKRPAVPHNIILFSDPNKDPDDVVTFTIAKQLQSMGFVRVRDAIITLGSPNVREARAQMAKGVFNSLGMRGVNVYMGKDYPMDDKQIKDHSKFLPEGLKLRAPDRMISGKGEESVKALELRLASAQKPVRLVVIAGMTDAAALVENHPDLMKKKVDMVTVMGGISNDRNLNEHVQPDKRAYNNTADQHAAETFYLRVQELGIPLRIISKEAAYKTAVPPSFYEAMAVNHHPVGDYLKDVQKNALKGLWEGVNAGLLPGLSREWFFHTFISEKDDLPSEEPASFEDIWPNVTRLNLYDPLTLLATVDASTDLLMTPKVLPDTGKSRVELVSSDEIREPEKARLLLTALAKTALQTPDPAPQSHDASMRL
ncbi:hypothetical protein BIY29_12270 [Brenneria alni]|uniref:Inosine/uridine-preferring nucleoside hydrolase domain-containing protein n=2 Tax=Brenneria alni TaxID=71656 RepID=A0A421DM80_9GAMM|nr:hypothetical protein BIY29_12270 [Brenneria alni]